MGCCNCGAIQPGFLNATAPPILDEFTITHLVENAGGNVNAPLRFSLAWNSWSDVDFHLNEPTGEHIFFSHKKSSATGGSLDVDMNISSNEGQQNTNRHSKPAVENIMYTDLNNVPDGDYRVSYVQYGVNNNREEHADTPYLLIEARMADEPKMSHYVLLKKNGVNKNADINLQIDLAVLRKVNGAFALKSIAEEVTILKVHNFDVGNLPVRGMPSNTVTENTVITGLNPIGG